jgi:uncharacterized membrane protein YfcA
MEIILICVVAFFASVLTFFSGYGLGTILLPVFSIFFPVELAIAMTAIVHLLNNIFKLALVGTRINMQVLFRFGLPSVIASFIGAILLTRLADLQPVGSYMVGTTVFEISPLKLTIGIVLLFFAFLEWFPGLLKIGRGRGVLFTGGLLSGFFGGLTGNQGALRSAFLIRAELSKDAFIATGVAIACLVDVARLFVYSGRMSIIDQNGEYLVIIAASFSAFAGAVLGNRLLRKITLKSLQLFVTLLLIIYSGLLMAGIL